MPENFPPLLTERVKRRLENDCRQESVQIDSGRAVKVNSTADMTEEILLETTCDKCDGSGCAYVGKDRVKVNCNACDGGGKVLTDFGRRVLELVWKYYDGISLARPIRGRGA